jgi:hypothetical protein
MKEPNIQSENGIDFTVIWRHGVPLYYFKYYPKKTRIIICIDTDVNIENVVLDSYLVKINEIGIDLCENNLSIEIDIRDSLLKPNNDAKKRYIGRKAIDIYNILPENMQDEKHLKIFKKVKEIELQVGISYSINGEKKTSAIKWIFTPKVIKSLTLWDKLMSV